MMRRPDIFYFLMRLLKEPSIMDMLSNMKELDTKSVIQKMIKHPRTRELMTLSLTEDVIQNLFRGTVRNINDNKPYMYNIYCNTREYNDMIDLLGQLHVFKGADIKSLPMPTMYRYYKALTHANDTKPKKILQWLITSPEGMYINTKLMYAAIGISSSQFNDVKDDAPYIKELFDKMKPKPNSRSYVLNEEVKRFLDKLSAL